ncbi:3-oxoacyl-(acyl carrier protein) reductase [Pyrobaculum aerophilum str. IM2]|uniref:3-oxoacyl-(Acyl carrier protein) reductase n=2 Tax=Pyrobaculum aerophilum TaxID=13773 RepID=Q8ZWW4_PYRAE|nr:MULTISPECIES: SDR family oxidoreductase [Pyrobaculum]AAL63585.1 3-oxoacyl-(acyl carrier protein) reductase [Pyrobaculum aerophilum str. IM2]HII46463.1 SDR family oxidoreductase [Pyrobaculum aerophilum]
MRIVVTGASGGIGRALIRVAKRRGDFTIGISRSPSEADVHYQCDVLDLRCLERAAGEVGPVDGLALVHGHGDQRLWVKPLSELSGDDFIDVFKVDVIGSFNVVKAFLPSLTPGASVVLVSSTPGLIGDVYGIPYSVAKGAVAALARSLAKVLAPVRVNAVAFGPIATRWTGWISEEEVRGFGERTVLKRLGTPEEAAEAIYWLLSPASSYVTGHVLVVDGGESL